VKSETFKSYIAVMVAIVTVLGATAACLASVAVSNAGDADFAGLDASIRAQKDEIVNTISAYEHYRAFTAYTRYNELGNLLYDPNADAETNLENGALQREVWGMASGISSSFFNPRYINQDGQYDLTRELQEEYAQSAQNEDLNSAPYFAKSDAERNRSSFLTANMIVFAVSFWFLTLAQTTEKRIKYVWATIGILSALAGILGTLIGRFIV